MNIHHTHTEFSEFDSAQTIKELVSSAKKVGATSVTKTEHGNLLGVDDFMKEGKKQGINTIPGVEVYLPEHLVIIPKNYEGFVDISKAVRESNEHQEVSKYNKKLVRPIMQKESMLQHFKDNPNIIISSACIAGPISKILLRNKEVEKKANKEKEKAAKYEPIVEDNAKLKKKHDEISKRIKELKAQRKEQEHYTSKAFNQKIAELENESQISLFAPNESAETLRQLQESAICVIENIDKELEEKNAIKKEYSKILSSYKTKLKTYNEIMGLLKEIEYEKEEDLYAEASQLAVEYKALYPNFYIEIQNHRLDEEIYVMPLLAKIARENHIPMIAANDAHMPNNSEDSITARQIMRYNYFSKHQDVSDADKELYVKNEDEMRQILGEILEEDVVNEAINNTNILDECVVIFPNEEHHPKVKNSNLDEILEIERQKWIADGRWGEEHETRLNYEKEIIRQMGFVDYHLVVQDFCKLADKLRILTKEDVKKMPKDFAKLQDWLEKREFRSGSGVGPGRGSAVGSLVCNMLGITAIDPLKYGLFFERYLNPERVTLPDIDSDIATRLRPAIIKYLKWYYGENAVCSIMTNNTYAAKGSLQMVGRDRADELYGHLPKKEKTEQVREYMKLAYALSDAIPEEPNATLIKSEDTVMLQYADNKEALLLWNRAKLVEGKHSGCGLHAGGVVISDNDNINEYTPLSWNSENQVWATQCSKEEVEEKGLIKMDLLGLSTLDVLSDCVHYIEKRYGVVVELNNLPFEAEVFKMYSEGKTNSVFQFESKGMKSMLKDFKPTRFEDLILLNAAYRPGPMQYLEKIIKVKNGEIPLTYKMPELESILSDTYGAIIYQEQVMQIFQKLAGYSLGGADMVRRIMSKKETDKLELERNAFLYGDSERNIIGCVANGLDEKLSNELFDEMTEFAKYAFNKSHATAYSYVSYQTAWLKYHYPLEFLCAMFNNKEQEKYAPIIEDCREFGIKLLPPNINRSYYEFVPEESAIRFGFKGIKGIGESDVVTDIIINRMTIGSEAPYKSFKDFMARNSNLNKRVMEAYIYSGVFDEFNPNRASLYKCYDEYNDFIDENIYVKEVDENTNRQFEIDYLGMIVSKNPLDDYKNESYYGCTPVTALKSGENSVLGLLSKIESRLSQKGNQMLILTLETLSGTINVLCMESTKMYSTLTNYDYNSKVVKLTGEYKDGTFFGRKIALQNPTLGNYFLDITELEEWQWKAKFINEHLNSGNEKLYVRSPFVNSDRMEYAKTYGPFNVSDEVIKKVKAVLWDGK